MTQDLIEAIDKKVSSEDDPLPAEHESLAQKEQIPEEKETYDYDNISDENSYDDDDFEDLMNDREELSSVTEKPQDLDVFPTTKSNHHNYCDDSGFINKVRSYFKPKNDTSLRETIEEYIESEFNEEEDALLSSHEKALLSNVLELHTMCAKDVMIPRVDIIGIPDNFTKEELFSLLAEKQYSRYPVFKSTLDNIVGSLHIKDVLATIARKEEFNLKNLIRDIPIISPSMHVLDLLTQMRMTRKHLVLVVDEFGGIDGLITIGDLIEAIVGEIDDEHNLEVQPEITPQIDGSLLADARYDIDEFEEIYGEILTEEEREENETLGGLMFFLAGRVPARGEVLRHSSGMIFEIVDADPRRVKRLRIRNIPQSS